jgi:hypothetical protein
MPTNPGPPSASAHAATPRQWIAVGIIMGGSILSGIALIEWVWPAFWAGIALMVAGSLMAWWARVMDAVSEWSPPPGSASGDTGQHPR